MAENRNDKATSSGPEHIGNILEALLQETGLEEQLRANRPLVLWDEVAGAQIAPYSRAAALEKGTLWVEVDNSVRMHRLQMDEATLRERINRALKEEDLNADVIRQIRFRLMQTV